LCRYFVYFCFVKEFSNSNPGRKRVVEFLNQPIYSGHIEVEKWDISLRKGRHEALITLETYYAIPERLHGKPRVPTRKNINADFPLRGFVTCGHCNQPLTANWSKGGKCSIPAISAIPRAAQAPTVVVRSKAMLKLPCLSRP
jgi:hypothetical protein